MLETIRSEKSEREAVHSYLGGKRDFQDGTMIKNPPDNAGDAGDKGSIPGLGRSPGGGNGNPLQYFCLEDYSPWDHKELDTIKQVSVSTQGTPK